MPVVGIIHLADVHPTGGLQSVADLYGDPWPVRSCRPPKEQNFQRTIEMSGSISAHAMPLPLSLVDNILRGHRGDNAKATKGKLIHPLRIPDAVGVFPGGVGVAFLRSDDCHRSGGCIMPVSQILRKSNILPFQIIFENFCKLQIISQKLSLGAGSSAA